MEQHKLFGTWLKGYLLFLLIYCVIVVVISLVFTGPLSVFFRKNWILHTILCVMPLVRTTEISGKMRYPLVGAFFLLLLILFSFLYRLPNYDPAQQIPLFWGGISALVLALTCLFATIVSKMVCPDFYYMKIKKS